MSLIASPTPAPFASPVLSGEVIALLEASGAMQTPHSGRTLFDHLRGTYELLRSWGNAQAVCLGGLFHSIYGTNAFAHQSLMYSQRGELRAVIGEEAEALAWLFCSMDRPRAIFWGLKQSHRAGALDVQATPQQFQALAEIECANLMEQGCWHTSLKELYCAAIDGTAALSRPAVNALRAGWVRQLSTQKGLTT